MTAGEPAILALDIGTSEAKGGLITAEGRLVATARRAYAMDLDPSIGRAEQDPESWWAALTAVTQDLVEARAPIVAVCCVGQAPTLVAVDARVEPVRPAIQNPGASISFGPISVRNVRKWIENGVTRTESGG